VFFYRLGARENSEAFRWLAHRAPGFLAGLASQVNTAFRFQVADGFARPPTQLLQPLHQPSGDPTDLLVFYHDVEWIIERGATKVDTSQGIQRTTYVPLTETALADQTFCNVIAALVAETYFDPSACVLLRLPTLPARTATLADRLAAAIMPLQQAKPRLPRVPSPGVFFLADDVSTAMLRALGAPATLLMHESFDFWRHPAAFYRSFASARVFAPLVLRGARAALVDLLSAALGCRPEISWLKPERVGFL
jgi:hypothetical protein